MTATILERMRDVVQHDVGKRGLGTIPGRNLITECAPDFAAACRSIADTPSARLAIVTGFFIPTGQPLTGETDGPLGALFLARALAPLGIRTALVSDNFCTKALQAGLASCGLEDDVSLVTLPDHETSRRLGPDKYRELVLSEMGPLTHLIALERVGPNHTAGPEEFARAVPPEKQDRCYTMRGRDITLQMSPVHWIFEKAPAPTIGIGDGGNEIGMGKIPWSVIHENIPGGTLVACRIPTDLLIVCGISNWGAYALAAGVLACRGTTASAVFDPDREESLLRTMVAAGPLVDGVTGLPTVSVDGLEFAEYGKVLRQLSGAIN